MSTEDDIKRVIGQEQGLVFSRFDEHTAFELGSLLRARAVNEALAVIIDIRLWDRPLFYAALPGTSASNADWARRKRAAVELFHRSTYRMVLEQGRPDQTFPPRYGRSPSDYVLAGGGFPITVTGVGPIGVIAVSGLPQRKDHELIVAGLCTLLGKSATEFSLPPRDDAP